MRQVFSIAAAFVFVLVALTPTQAQTAFAARSPDLATELTGLLAARGLDAIAAPDPAEADRFVAALAFPKAQLLVVGATYPVPALVLQQIGAAKYRDVYLALQQSGADDGKLFFLDLGCDGLRGSTDNVDILYEGATKRMVFDGSPEKHKVARTVYEKQFATAETSYAHLLTVLIDHLKASAMQ